MSKVAVILSALGFGACIFGYVASFSGPLVDRISPGFIPLLIMLIFLALPMWALEYHGGWEWNPFPWKKFARGMPTWVAPCGLGLSLVTVAHIAWFAFHSGMGTPAILDGQYVLDSRGHILKILTQSEYFALSGAFVRGGATLMASFYYVPMTYWWFRRNDRTQP